LEPLILEYKEVKIAFIGAVCFPLEGYVYLPDAFDLGRWDAQLIGTQIRNAKQKADVIVVCLHWGIEFSHYPTSTQIQMGHYCIDQGADLVIGHHPHVIQGMEIYHGKPICYSLGNFIFDQRYGPATESLFVKVTITKKRIKQLEIVPITIRECLPHLADTESATKIRENFLKYSEPFDLKNTETNRWEL
jgi:poly-gamma-glutamate synthesis protein (capsule biosynthesis protein)